MNVNSKSIVGGGVKYKSGVILFTYEPEHKRIQEIPTHIQKIGLTTSGIGVGNQGDVNRLLQFAQKEASKYYKRFSEYPNAKTISNKIASEMQHKSQSIDFRDYDCEFLLTESEGDNPQIYHVMKNGEYNTHNVIVIGKKEEDVRRKIQNKDFKYTEKEKEEIIEWIVTLLSETFESSINLDVIEIKDI